ncbi:U-box domain-containing protein 44-like [Phalaenopsis equestris]|uniref:U-box domain-containing protein 44-like n=1 Tax=Phalaenopsis equestris TaxID=78828 RepID=UPI0009E302DE|nr:U-box domain-containing protein 44-like [Phalaenopsis equestris]
MSSTATFSPPPMPPEGAASFDSISRTLTEICSTDDDFTCDPPRRFTALVRRLQLLFQEVAAFADLSPPPALTAIRGISADLEASRAPLSAYRSPSRIRILINCDPLCTSLRTLASSISSSLNLLDSLLSPFPDLRKKAADLSVDFQCSDIRLTENEVRVYRTLQKEAEVRSISKAVQSAIIMDVARALGIDPCDHPKLSENIKQLRSDISCGLSSVAERKILMSLEKIFDSWSTETCLATAYLDADFEENAQIPPFKSFICPLTKEVMKDPVVLESSQNYDRFAILKWFERCMEDGRAPTCPMTGQEQVSLELKRNIGLAGTIEEWVNRNIEVQIKAALQYLGEGGLSSEDSAEKVLNSLYRISEEHPESRYRVRNAGIVNLVVQMLKKQSKLMGSRLRWKALMTLHSMARDEESKLIMLKEGITRLAIRSLSETSEKEREFALRILLDFSVEEEFSLNLALEKGALYLLTSIAGNSNQPSLSNLAEDVLNSMEKVEGNIESLSKEGRYQPLLIRLCEGSKDVRMEIVKLLGKMNLTDSGRNYIARKGGRVLVGMLSSNVDGLEPSLRALYNLSSLSDNAAVLVGQGLLPALTAILFTKQLDGSSNLKELAALTMAKIVSNPGHWESSFADNEGHEMHSAFIIHKLVELLDLSSGECRAAVLHVLCGVMTSPKASDSAATHIRSCNGIKTILQFLELSDESCRAHSFRLLSLLSEKMGQVILEEFRSSGKIPFLKERLQSPHSPLPEKADISCILSNLPFSDTEVTNLLGPDLLTWAVTQVKIQSSNSLGKNSKNARNMIDGLLGLLLHYSKNHDPKIISLIQETHFMAIFREQLSNHSNHRVKRLGALGLKYLSESASLSSATRDSEVQPFTGFCAPFVLLCGKPSVIRSQCPFHSVHCADDSSFCLLKANAIKQLIDLMDDDNIEVQLAAVEALLTLISDTGTFEKAVEKLEEFGLFKEAVLLLKGLGPGELQERVVLMVDIFLQKKSLAEQCATNSDLVKALVEALKHGNANTRSYAQDALQNLNQISGIGDRLSR